MRPTEATYLGDGLYVSVDGGRIQLRAPRWEGEDVVYLDAETLENFMIWLRGLRQAALEHGPDAVA